MGDEIRVEADGGVGRLLIDREHRGHAWSSSMWDAAAEAIEAFAEDESVRVVLLDSTGDRVFSGGADLDELLAGASDGTTVVATLDRVERLMAAIEQAPQVVVAVISGSAIGAGLEIAAAADVRIASSDAKLGIPAAALGVVITRTDIARLCRAAGYALATELLLTGRIIGAEEAWRRGLVSDVFEPAALRAGAEALAGRIGGLERSSVVAMKQHLAAVAPRADWSPAAFDPSVAALRSTPFKERAGARSSRSSSGESKGQTS